MTGAVSSHTWIVAAVYLAAGVISALAARGLLTRLHRKAEQTRWRGGDIVVAFLRLVTPWCLGVGCAWAAFLALPLRSVYRYDVDHTLLAVIVVVVSLGIAKVAGAAVHAGATSHAGTSGSATIFVSITRVIVWTIGGLVLLDSLGVAITPLLTALGVGGLAVALALQDTLSNLFAGVHILTSRKVQPGDFIQLDNGMQGYVEDTNWRNTIIRQLPNNMLVVPNATVASSIVTNYHLPEREISVIIPCTVSYESDLNHVERVTIAVGQEVMLEVNGAILKHAPTVRYTAFGNSGISFNVGLRADDISAQDLIIHEFIKRLHSRYQEVGICNSSPSEMVVYARSQAGDTAHRPTGAKGEPAVQPLMPDAEPLDSAAGVALDVPRVGRSQRLDQPISGRRADQAASTGGPGEGSPPGP